MLKHLYRTCGILDKCGAFKSSDMIMSHAIKILAQMFSDNTDVENAAQQLQSAGQDPEMLRQSIEYEAKLAGGEETLPQNMTTSLASNPQVATSASQFLQDINTRLTQIQQSGAALNDKNVQTELTALNQLKTILQSNGVQPNAPIMKRPIPASL